MPEGRLCHGNQWQQYAKEKEYLAAGLYIDDGDAAHKKHTKRPGLMRLPADVEADKIGAILFIKLDRWFRNIKEYYKVQEILDRHGVKRRACLEEYERDLSGRDDGQYRPR